MKIENPLLALYRGTEYFSLARTFRTVWGGKRRVSAHKISTTGAKTHDLPPRPFKKLHDVCSNVVFAHVNPMTYVKESILPTALRQQIRGGREGRAERLGLGQRPHNIAKKSDRSAARASSDAGRRTAKRWPCAPVRTEA